MANYDSSKTGFLTKNPKIVVESKDETWTIVSTADANEATHTLQNDSIQVEVINLDYYDGGALTGRARVAIAALQTADTKNYIPLPSAGSVTIDVGGIGSLYYRRETATNVTLLIRERRI